MRIKIGEYIEEVNCVFVRNTDIMIGTKFFPTGEDTEKIGNQLLTQGYADLSAYRKREY